MEFEDWWLLIIPLFFFLGWFAARLDVKQLLNESKTVPDSYFRGINYLFNEERDKAIDAMIALADTDQDSVDLQFLVAGFFRQRGELQKATAIHKSLLDRPDLSAAERLKALYEMGLNYYKAGFMDRAEHFLLRVNSGAERLKALTALEKLYVSEKEWEKAVTTAKNAGNLGVTGHSVRVAQYMCEIGDLFLQSGKLDLARAWFDKAIIENANCVRAVLALSKIDRDGQRFEAALDRLKGLRLHESEYSILIAEEILNLSSGLKNPRDGLQLIEELLFADGSPEFFGVLVREVKDEFTFERLAGVIRDRLRNTKNIIWASLLVKSRQTTSDSRYDEEDDSLIEDALTNYTLGARYGCQDCGFKAERFHWQCPACSKWETFCLSRNSRS